MWVLRGIAFVATSAESILVPPSLTHVTKASLGLGGGLYPVPMLAMLACSRDRHDLPHAHRDGPPHLRLRRQHRGEPVRRTLAVAGSRSACSPSPGSRRDSPRFSARASTARRRRVTRRATSCTSSRRRSSAARASIGGRGSALGATLGALLIVLIRQSIRTLHFDQNYEWIVIGCAIILAVVVDQSSTRLTARRLAGRAAIAGESP